MLSTHPDLPIYLDSTMISTFRACPQKFYLQFVHNLRPSGGLNIHLAAGAAFAAALETIRNAQALHPDEPLDPNYLWSLAVEPAIRAFGEPNDQPESPKNIHNVLYALELYLQSYHPFYDEVKPLVVGGKPTTEFSFAIPLPVNHPSGEPFIYVGRFDLLGAYRSNDLLVVLDDKTTSSLGPYWLNQWDLRGQFLGYTWACQQLGYKVNNCLVRGTGLLKTETNFAQVPLSYPPHLIDRWYHELLDTIEQIKFYHERQKYPYNFAESCSSFGGCPMKQLCLAKEPEQWLNNYHVEVWNPVTEDA